MEWRTRMPRGTIEKGQAKIIVSVKYSDGSRIETESTVSEDSAALITKQAVANQIPTLKAGQ